jgi:hypothetical protein
MSDHKIVSYPHWKEHAERISHERNPNNINPEISCLEKPLDILKDFAW